MINQAAEMIWRGHTHIGDEPGIYGYAEYSGLAAEWPMTLTPFDPTSSDTRVRLKLHCTGVKVYSPYPGHAVELRAFVPDPTPANPYQYKEVSVSSLRLDTDSLTIPVSAALPAPHLSLTVRVDTSVKPGLYDDFLVIELALESDTHYAQFGFR